MYSFMCETYTVLLGLYCYMTPKWTTHCLYGGVGGGGGVCVLAYEHIYFFVWFLDKKAETEVWGPLPVMCLKHSGCCILLCA